MSKATDTEMQPLDIAVLTVSDSRGEEDDTSGQYLVDSLKVAGHQLAEKVIVRDDIYQIRAVVSHWIADTSVEVVLITGGTGFSGRDSTPEAIEPLLHAITSERDKHAHGAMLITLGKSGVPEAKPHIDGALPVYDEDVRRWAARALKYWLVATGRMHPDQDLPDHWPYGQPGFPPPMRSQIDDD